MSTSATTETNGHLNTQDASGGEGAGPGQEQRGAALQPEAREGAGGTSGAALAEQRRAFLEARIRGIEEQIEVWRRRHSQSDPAAIWELRELKRELDWWREMLAAE